MSDITQDPIRTYYEITHSLLHQTLETQHGNMLTMARLWAAAIQTDHLLYAFGSGHSRFIAGELYWRAGGLAAVMQIDDPTRGQAERIEGYAETMMRQYLLSEGDLLLVISNSGINPVPIEVARWGKSHGAQVIALTNLDYSKDSVSRHSSGKRLFELADLVLDIPAPRGDAAVKLTGVAWRCAPVSTLLGVSMLEAVVAQTAHIMLQAGQIPPVLLSANIPEGDQHNKQVAERYWPRLATFPRKPLDS